MTLLATERIEKWFADRMIVRAASLRVARGDRIGLVGPNGCGKTTLLTVLSGDLEPDAGAVRRASDVRVARQAQGATPAEATVEAYLGPARMRVEAIEAEMRDLEPRLADDAAALERYAEVSATFEHAGGYAFEAEVARVLGALGFSAAHRARPIVELSQGQRVRLSLARLLLEDPDVLLLDEPTNHLDVVGLEWLERFLLERERTFIVVSHDRYFLDRVTTRTWSFDGPDVRAHRGGYSAFLRQRAARADPARAKTTWRVSDLPARGTYLLETTPLAVGYDRDRPVAATPALHVPVAARVAIVGPNASGKTTLLRTLVGELPALEGYVRTTSDARAAVLDESAERSFGATAAGTVLASFRAATGLLEQEARDLLARFLFSGDDALRDVRTLSGGERRRLAVATALARPANLLVLDEPTERLDVHTREALERALLEFRGALLVASHDRYFVDRVASVVWLVQDGAVRVFEGNYSAMRRRLDAAGAAQPDRSAPVRHQAQAPRTRTERTAARRNRPDRIAARRAASLSALEARIEEIEKRLATLAQRVSDIAQAGNYLESRRVGEEYAELERALHLLYDEWASGATGEGR